MNARMNAAMLMNEAALNPISLLTIEAFEKQIPLPEQSAFSPQLSDLTLTRKRTHCWSQSSETTVKYTKKTMYSKFASSTFIMRKENKREKGWADGKGRWKKRKEEQMIDNACFVGR